MPLWHAANEWVLLYYNRMKRLSMLKRVTIMLEEELVRKIRWEQGKLLQNSTSSVSFSQVLSQYLKQSLKNGDTENCLL